MGQRVDMRVGDDLADDEKMSKLRLRLLEDGRPQYVIAAELGVSPPRLSDYVHGVRPIPVARIYTFCRVLRCNPEDLLGWDGE